MTTTVTEVKQRLADIQATISGITRAFPNAPRQLTDADLPAFVNYAGEASYETRGDDYGEHFIHENRLYLMRLFIMRLPLGLQSEAEIDADTYLSPVKLAFVGRRGLELDSTHLGIVKDSELQSDSGTVQGIPYGAPDRIYAAIEFQIRVETLEKIEYFISS